MTTLVRDLMRQAIITCPPDTTLGQAASLLVRHRLHALVVADAANQPIGIISDIDLLTGEWLSADADSLATMRAMTVSTLMTSPVATIEADVPASQAAVRMQAERLHRLPYGDGDSATWTTLIQDWQAAGATHFSLNTMGVGFDTPAAHLAALRKFAEAIGLV